MKTVVPTEKSADELEYSRIFDVHTWSDHLEVNQFINLIHEQYFSEPLHDIQKKHLKKLLLD